MKKRAYRSTPVKDVKISSVVLQLPEGPVQAGLDVGKEQVMTVIRDSRGDFLRPWKAEQPGGIRVLTERLQELAQHRPLVIAMEPTGTYGDPLRQALSDAGLVVHRVSPKASSDYAEVFDGVPSQHDGKDAAVVAELTAIGKSQPWPVGPAVYGGMLHEVQWMDTQQDILQLWLGHLEGLLARHWPELTTLLELNSATLLRIVAEYGGPQALCQDPEATAKIIRWAGPFMKREKVEAVVTSAQSTTGMRMTDEDRDYMQRFARAAQTARKEIQQVQNVLEKRVQGDEVLQRVGQGIGMVTACVLFATVGDPREYSCGEAYRKALGLNLKERSSGKHQGHLKITKRGPSIARRWLYFTAMRMVQQPVVKLWYDRKKSMDQERGGKSLVAVMRKLALAVYAVGQGAKFDPARLFPGRNLSANASGKPAPPPGALPPDPRNLAPADQGRTAENPGAAVTPARRDPASVPGAALGSVSTGALSSAQAEQS